MKIIKLEISINIIIFIGMGRNLVIAVCRVWRRPRALSRSAAPWSHNTISVKALISLPDWYHNKPLSSPNKARCKLLVVAPVPYLCSAIAI